MLRIAAIAFMIFCSVTMLAQSPHGDAFKIDCASCHDASGWTSMKQPMLFDHDSTGFELEGRHAVVNCKECHTTLDFTESPNKCSSCHTDVHNMSVGNDCARCHTSQNWLVDNIPELHEQNGFPLFGVHSNLSCVDCHTSETNLNFTPIGNDCINCHMQDYNSTVYPNHQLSDFSTNCIDCHDPMRDGWESDIIGHEFFPLTGGHDIQDCKQCHVSKIFADASPECTSCHLDDYNSTTNPNHAASQLPTDCRQCHNENAWIPSSFDHSFFPFVGAHAPIANNCIDCHHGNYVNTPNSCDGCHMPDYNTTASPNHTAAHFPTDCAVCHNESAWIPSSFTHSDFPLIGAHAAVSDCNDCHHGSFTNTPSNCDACHMPDYTGATNPNHGTSQFPVDCAICHNETAWAPSSFTHSSFPLVDAHAAVPNCNDCHHGNFTNTPSTCDACHMPDYNASTNPNHSAAQFPTDCAVCHNEAAWIPSGFTHNSWPLTGAHASVPNCNDCHHGNFTNTPNTCDACHMPDYNTSTNPNHSTAQFPTDCAMCHDETAWSPSGFTHNSWPLNGAHASVSNCNDCHHGNFTTTPNTCDACHMPDYNASTNPNHSAAQFPTDCATCHNETAWTPSGFTHNSWPLTGAHASVSNCNDCHHGNFTNTPNTCDACHMPDFNATTNPNHVAAMFSTDCTICHNVNAWTPSSFDHDASFFPIYSGKHNGEWNSCTDCHINSSNYAIFSCIDCHEHNNQTNVNNDHNGVSGYSYNSNACLNCHPNGN